LAACVGNHFSLDALSIIYEKSTAETFQSIMPVLTEGLILPSSSLEISGEDIQSSPLTISHFRFLHDRVQQAAYTLIAQDQKQAVHLQIGRVLLKNTQYDEDELEDHLFDLVGHLNHGLALLDNEAEKHQIAQLNLRAGQKAKKASAYGAAINYLDKGLQCLKADSWQT
jgi:predicted ATPase